MRNWILMAAMAAVALGADPAGFIVWHSGDLKGFEKSLAPKIDQNKVATQNLTTYSNHRSMIAHREGNGQAEWHEHDADLFVVQTGEATLIVGGTIPNVKTTAPGEKRGASIDGGTKQKLSAGDIVHIPKATPHQLMVDTGKQFTYFALKVTEK